MQAMTIERVADLGRPLVPLPETRRLTWSERLFGETSVTHVGSVVVVVIACEEGKEPEIVGTTRYDGVDPYGPVVIPSYALTITAS